MVECYGSWLQSQREDELDRADREQLAMDKVDSEIQKLLGSEFEEVYEDFVNSEMYNEILLVIAKRKYPKIMGINDPDDF